MKSENLNLKRVAAELNIDVPIMAIRALKDGFELTLYGGRVIKYTPKRQAQQPAPSPEPAVPPSPKAATSAQPEPQAAATPKVGDAGESEPQPAQQPEPSPEPAVSTSPEPAQQPEPEPQPAGSLDLESLTVKELRKMAGQAGIANASRLTKAQLILSLSQE